MDDVKFGEILLPGDEETQSRREKTVREGFWPKIARVARKVPFARDAVAAWYCATDPATPSRVKGVLFAALAYFVMPADLIPDIFVLIGFSDDMAVLAAAFAMIRGHIRDRHYEAADRALAAVSPEGDMPR